MHDPQLMVTKNLAFEEARKLSQVDPENELLKYANSHQIFWEEFVTRFGGCSVSHQERVAQAYNKYFLILKKMNQKNTISEDEAFETKNARKYPGSTEEFHNSLGYY